MNKRHYEHTLPNIRGSLSNTYIPVRINILILKLFDILKLKYSDIKMFLN